MANPTLAVPDIPRLSQIAHSHGARLVVDNTFCPVIISPAPLGADVVVHSLTKFISGSSDIIAGAICGTEEFIGSLMDLKLGALMLLGPTMDPTVAFNISLRLPHLGIRMAEHSRRALVFAERLEQRGIRVVYPGLPRHPHHETLKELSNEGFGYGGMLAIDTGDAVKANKLMEILQNKDRFGYIAVSLGYFDTLMTRSAVSTSSELSDDDKAAAGISSGLVRMSIGYTGSIEQRWDQLDDALRSVDL
jgi:methionine-gamma-lyase